MAKSVLVLLALGACTEPPLELTPREQFVIRRELTPTTQTQSREYAVDLNGDKVVDNQLGSLLSTLHNLYLFDFQTPSDALIAQGVVVVPIELSWTDDNSRMGVAIGDSEPLIIPVDRASAVSDTGTVHLGVGFLGPMQLELQHARVHIREHTADKLTGTIGGALSKDEVYGKLLAAWVGVVQAIVERDCTALDSPPTCGCTNEYGGAYWIEHLDTVQDCAITVDEMKATDIVQSLLAPDLSYGDGYLLSFGIDFEAVTAP